MRLGDTGSMGKADGAGLGRDTQITFIGILYAFCVVL